MRTLRLVLLAALSLVIAPATSWASTILVANLTNGGETPPVVPTTVGGLPRLSFGTATFLLNDTMTAMTFTATVTGIDYNGTQSLDINDNLSNAHIHAGLVPSPTGTFPVVWGFLGSPLNDISPNDVVLTPFATGVGFTVSGKWDQGEGQGTTLTAQLSNILNGRSYINFHTTQFGGGEIRGVITQVDPVPEPATIVLLGIGLAGLVVSRRARR